jgi:hypothetical protein
MALTWSMATRTKVADHFGKRMRETSQRKRFHAHWVSTLFGMEWNGHLLSGSQCEPPSAVFDTRCSQPVQRKGSRKRPATLCAESRACSGPSAQSLAAPSGLPGQTAFLRWASRVAISTRIIDALPVVAATSLPGVGEAPSLSPSSAAHDLVAFAALTCLGGLRQERAGLQGPLIPAQERGRHSSF